jgi:cysteine desulfurase family protein
MIYFDNAATSFPKPKEVPDAVTYAMNNFGNAGRGFYGIEAMQIIYSAREKAAAFFNTGEAENVAFTSNVTESLNLVINSLLTNRGHVITSIYEHNSVLRPLYKMGCELTFVKAANEVAGNIRGNTKAVIINHASNVTGEVFDIKQVGEICSEHNILFILDVAQTAGFLDIDMKKNGIAILCFTGHKSLLGPQGVGGICVNSSKAIDFKAVKVGGTGFDSYNKSHINKMPGCFEAGTLNSHSIHGFSAALDFLNNYGLANIREQELDLLYYFYNALKQIKKVKIYGGFENRGRGPVISFNIGGIDSNDVSLELYEKAEIASRPGAHCAPLIHKYYNLEKQGSVRFSFSFNNQKQEIDRALELISDISKNA